MKPGHETEIKLPVWAPRALKRRLAQLGFRPIGARRFESNILFDFPRLSLQKARCLLRLRFANRQGVLTFKGPPLRGRQYKIRREIEAEVSDGEQVRKILRSIGLRENFRYEKYRTVFAQPGRARKEGMPLLLYDETPIGIYLELEGPERWIDRIAFALSYGREDYITASYGTLYRKECLRRGAEPGHMVFPSRKR